MFDAEFLKGVKPLRNPFAGTEHMALLLYSLVRATRPKTLLEIGMGYTSPFLLRALADNVLDFERDRRQLKAKTSKLLTPNASRGRDTEHNWISEEPPMADPGYYLEDYVPRMFAFDDFSDKNTSAPRVVDAIEGLGLSRFLTFFNGDPTGQSERIETAHLPIDFAWNDADNYLEFFDEYWPLINPNGGLLLFHNTANAWQSNGLVLKELKLRQMSDATSIELLSLVEPHKFNQRSVTMLRKTTKLKESYFEMRNEEIRANAVRLATS